MVVFSAGSFRLANACDKGVMVSTGLLLLCVACVANRKFGVENRELPAGIPLDTYVPKKD